MPLEQLVEHFNERFYAEHGLKTPLLQIKGGLAEGVWGSARIGSHLEPVHLVDTPQTIVGHIARTHVYPDHGIAPSNADSLYATTTPDRIVDFDRLCRTVHMLNYLPISHLDGFLLVDVNPQHVLNVPKDHGAYFEEIIFRCGLPANRIAISLTVDTTAIGQRGHLFAALRNYKRRGYRIAVNLTQPGAIGSDLDAILCASPDYLRMEAQSQFGNAPHRQRIGVAGLRPLVKTMSASGGDILLTGIDTHSVAAATLEAGVDLGQGRYFDETGGLKKGRCE